MLSVTTDIPATGADLPRRIPAPVRAWRAFRTWRRTRPFWGGLLLLLAGGEIFASGMAPLHVVVHLGLQGLAGQAVPLLMAACGLLLWFSPDQRLFYAIVGMVLSAGSWITSNLGGFILGLLLGMVGSSLAFAWAPRRVPAPERLSAQPNGPVPPPPGAGSAP
jgi:hypothetical protein